MTAQPAPVLPDPEVARLHRVLKDVRFCLERGDWETALAAVRAALTCAQSITVPRTSTSARRNGSTTPSIGTV
jgi:hypothetical protein